MGFAFDGDSDRVIAVAENGRVVDGDQIVYLFALDLKNNNQLKNNTVVGTVLTNMGIEKALECKNIKLIRADVGDRNVSECLKSNDLLVGGEQSGHVIVTNKLATGDGILNALLVASICVKSKLTLSQLLNVELFHQSCQNVEVKNKSKIMHSQTLINAQKYEEKIMGKNGRILIRASGTEPCIRVMVESIDQKLAGAVCERLSAVVHKIDLTENLCVE